METPSAGANVAVTRSNKVARNITTTLISQIVTWGLSFSVILFLPHYAGASGFGRLYLAASFSTLFGLLSALGTSTVLMRDIPRDPGSTGQLVLASLIARLPLAVVGVFLGWLTGKALGYGNIVMLFIMIGLLSTIGGVILDTASSAVRGLENFAIANIGSVIDKAISSLITILACVFKGPLWLVAAATLISSLFSTAYILRGLVKLKMNWALPDWDTVKSLSISGLPFISASIFMTIYGRSDVILLSKMSTDQAVGWYGLGSRIAGTAMTLPTVVCSAMLPPLSALFRENESGFIDGTRRLTNLMILCCIPIAAIMLLCPEPLVNILSHGTASFLPSVNVVQVDGLTLMLWFISQASCTGVIACDRQKVIGSSTGMAAVFGIPLTAGCIYVTQQYYHNGATGAAVSDLLIEVFLVICYCLALPKGIMSISMLETGFRAIIAASPLIIALTLLPVKSGLIAIIPCVAIYAFLCLRLKCISPGDAQLLGRMIGGKFGLSKI